MSMKHQLVMNCKNKIVTWTLKYSTGLFLYYKSSSFTNTRRSVLPFTLAPSHPPGNLRKLGAMFLFVSRS